MSKCDLSQSARSSHQVSLLFGSTIIRYLYLVGLSLSSSHHFRLHNLCRHALCRSKGQLLKIFHYFELWNWQSLQHLDRSRALKRASRLSRSSITIIAVCDYLFALFRWVARDFSNDYLRMSGPAYYVSLLIIIVQYRKFLNQNLCNWHINTLIIS